MSDPRYHCRVCGFRHETPPWGLDGKTPFYTHCDCCGCEVGWQDRTPEKVRKTREEWIERGMPWFSRSMRPENWGFESQRADIPEEYR